MIHFTWFSLGTMRKLHTQCTCPYRVLGIITSVTDEFDIHRIIVLPQFGILMIIPKLAPFIQRMCKFGNSMTITNASREDWQIIPEGFDAYQHHYSLEENVLGAERLMGPSSGHYLLAYMLLKVFLARIVERVFFIGMQCVGRDQFI